MAEDDRITEQIDNVLNRDGDILPFALYNPITEGKLSWMCGLDAAGKITSVYTCDTGGITGKERHCAYLEDMSAAIQTRDVLIEHGWKKVVPPKITFTFDKKFGEQSSLTRAQKRSLQKRVKKSSGVIA